MKKTKKKKKTCQQLLLNLKCPRNIKQTKKALQNWNCKTLLWRSIYVDHNWGEEPSSEKSKQRLLRFSVNDSTGIILAGFIYPSSHRAPPVGAPPLLRTVPAGNLLRLCTVPLLQLLQAPRTRLRPTCACGRVIDSVKPGWSHRFRCEGDKSFRDLLSDSSSSRIQLHISSSQTGQTVQTQTAQHRETDSALTK